MRVVTYLGFTLLSILIQFSVIDFIQSIMQLDEKLIDSTNATSQKRQYRDVLKDLSYKPHALYYKTQINKHGKSNAPAKMYDNSSLPELLTSTESTTAVFEILYDDSTSATEAEDTSFTTEAVYSSTELDNVTEISFFGNANQTTRKPTVKPKKKSSKDCMCNFLYEVCDINCCCDADCSETELTIFSNCTKNNKPSPPYDEVCYSHLFYFSQDDPITTSLNDWFCIVKINLPEKKAEIKETYPLANNNFFTWKKIENPRLQYEFTNKIYEYGDPIWLIKNQSIYYIDVPSPVVNSYCTGRKTIQFLKNHNFSCYVKIPDLDMLQVVKSSEEASVISATPLSMNSTYLNCSCLHCINWTLIICKDLICSKYNKSVHEPACTESICTNLALKLEYIFNYHDSKIINATIKFHVQNVPINLNYIQQEIEVKFVLTNNSIERVLKLSGNPGYVNNLPIIVLYAESNYTDTFYNNSSQLKYMTLPKSKGGVCVASNLADNFVLFGPNRRIKCRYYHKYTEQNGTEQCKLIQSNLNTLLESKSKVAVSPLGNPENLKDKEWLPMSLNFSEKSYLYGELYEKSSKLYCYNIITRYSFVFSYAEISGNNRILAINFGTTSKNTSFSLDDISVVVTVDVNFVDVSKPSVIQYASGGPNLNLHLPNDFFLPFPSNESQLVRMNVFCLILYCCVAIVASK